MYRSHTTNDKIEVLKNKLHVQEKVLEDFKKNSAKKVDLLVEKKETLELQVKKERSEKNDLLKSNARVKSLEHILELMKATQSITPDSKREMLKNSSADIIEKLDSLIRCEAKSLLEHKQFQLTIIEDEQTKICGDIVKIQEYLDKLPESWKKTVDCNGEFIYQNRDTGELSGKRPLRPKPKKRKIEPFKKLSPLPANWKPVKDKQNRIYD